MLKRSLTLLETIIALVLVVALGALVLPMLMDSLDERAFESAADETSEQLLLARAHAQATGTPVEVTYNADTSKVEARFFLLESGSSVGAFGDEDFVGPPVGASAGKRAPSSARSALFDESNARSGRADTAAYDPRVIAEAWATRILGSGLRILTHPPAESAEMANRFKNDEDKDYETLADLATGQEIRLAVFMPDGSALMGEPVWLNDAAGRCGMITINPWTGQPVFTRLETRGSEPSAASDAQPLPTDRTDPWLDEPARTTKPKSDSSRKNARPRDEDRNRPSPSPAARSAQPRRSNSPPAATSP